MDYNNWKQVVLSKVETIATKEPFKLEQLFTVKEWKSFGTAVKQYGKKFKKEVEDRKIENVVHVKISSDNHNWYKKVFKESLE